MPAPMQTAIRPAIYRFKIGGFEVTNILDSAVIRHGLAQGYGGPASVNDLISFSHANHIDPDRYEHPFIPTLVNTGRELVLFDTGNGALRREHEQFRDRLPDGLLVERMRQAGYEPEEVDVVVITHGHPDHIGGLTVGGKPVFENARYVFGAGEFDFWKRGENVREARKFNRDLFLKIALPLIERTSFIKPGEEVVQGITAIDVAGHSPGMMAYLIENQGERLLNWADTCGHYVFAIQQPEFFLDVDDDKEKAAATRKRILDLVAREALLITGYHMPFPGIGYVERTEASFRWVPHSYQLHLSG